MNLVSMTAKTMMHASRRGTRLMFALLFMIGFSISANAQEIRKLTADDYAEILQLYFRYPLTLDSGDGEAFADLFTEDGKFGANVTGREALVKFATREAGAVRHAPLTPLIVPSAEGATGVVTNLFIDVSQSPAVITRVSQYTDVLVKTPLGWRFKSRNNGIADLRDPKATTAQSLP